MSTSQRPRRRDDALLKFDCPTCGARPGYFCLDQRVFGGNPMPIKWPHALRMAEARKAGY